MRPRTFASAREAAKTASAASAATRARSATIRASSAGTRARSATIRASSAGTPARSATTHASSTAVRAVRAGAFAVAALLATGSSAAAAAPPDPDAIRSSSRTAPDPAAVVTGSIPTTYPGWETVGPVGVGVPAGVVADDRRLLVTGSGTGSDRTEDPDPFLAITPAGARWGTLPPEAGQPSGWDSGTLLAGGTCGLVWASDDLGRTGGPRRVAPCPGPGERYQAHGTMLRVRDVDVVVEDGVRVPLGAIERTDDAGATWVPTPLPGAVTGQGGETGLPGLAAYERRTDGVILVGARGVLLESRDTGRSVRAVPLPDREETRGTAPPTVSRIVCDPANACAVEQRRSPDRPVAGTSPDPAALPRTVTRFGADGAFGEPLAPVPAGGVIAPAPGVLVGVGVAGRDAAGFGATGGPADVVPAWRRSVDGGRTYRTATRRHGTPRSVGDHHLLALPVGDELRLSSDRGRTWTTVPRPDAADGTEELVSVSRSGPVLFAVVGRRLLRRAGGAWTPVDDAGAIRPRAVAQVPGGVLAVGTRGVARVDRGGRVAVVRAGALAGRSFAGVATRGRRAFAWSGSYVVRSSDAGRRWTRVPRFGRVDDLQVVSATDVVALQGPRLLEDDRPSTLHRSTDGGRRFRRAAVLPALGYAGPGKRDDDEIVPRLEFVDARRGAVVTDGGAHLTGDGGRTAQAVPALLDHVPALAVPFDRGVAIQDPATGTVLRSGARAWRRSTLELRVVGRSGRGPDGSRVITVVGRLRGGAPGAQVAFVRRGPGGATTTLVDAATGTNLDGTFRRTLSAPRGSRVRATVVGRIDRSGTTRSATSRSVPVR